MNTDDFQALRRLQQLCERYRQNKAQPSLAERRSFSSAADLEKFRQLRADPTPKSILLRQAAMLKLKQRRLAGCARAWTETVQPYIAFEVHLVDLQRGKLIASVANHAHKYQLSLALRGGRLKHFQQRCSAAVSDVHVVVGAAPRLEVSSPRLPRAADDRENEIVSHVDLGIIAPDQAGELAGQIADAEVRAIANDDGVR